MALIRIHEKPNAVPVNASVFILSTKVNGVWYDQKVTWEQLTGLIAALNNLENYYLKTETYTKTEVNQLIAQIPSFTVEIVQELPTEDISTTTLYLVPKTTAGTLDYYDEFINLDGTTSGWEYVGKTEVDLSNYYTKAETEAYVKGDGADYIAGTKTFNSLTTTAKNILGAINEVAGAASGAQADATQALADASAAQGTANSASSAASAAQGTADNALTAAGNAAGAAAAAQGTANNAMTTAQSMAVSVTNTLTPGDTTKKVADVTQNNTTVPIYGDDAEKVVVALTDTKTTAAGNPVTFTTKQAGGAKSALVTFAPKQSGTGDPSPSNIRPISGWDGLMLTRTGKNLLNQNTMVDGYVSAGGIIADPSPTALELASDYILISPNTDYVFSVSVNNNYAKWIGTGFYDLNKNFIERVTLSPGLITDLVQTLHTPNNAMYMRVSYRGYGISQNPQVELGSIATAYEPYKGRQTNTATFGQTYYGGKYDFVSGKLTIEKVTHIFDGTENFVASSNNRIYTNSITDIYIPTVTDEVEILCSHFKGVSYDDRADGTVYQVTGNNAIYFRDNTYCTDVTTFKNFVTAQYNASTPVVLAYKLATPTEITLTPADVNLLKGSNTVWTDGDTVQVKYSELPNGNLGAVIDYIQKLEARVKALES